MNVPNPDKISLLQGFSFDEQLFLINNVLISPPKEGHFHQDLLNPHLLDDAPITLLSSSLQERSQIEAPLE
eukprot:XP_001706647.1 Hypothetical protein GL50803_91945 [Giardia lamblia ATCC 50803]